MPNWTSEQKLAIDKDGSNIIVSAGAGSGKTAVLTERVVRKIRDGVNIDHLLVLTFTNAAAAEMKDRIRKSIKKEGMVQQLDYLDSAYITTFDSYAQSIVKKYYYLLGISSTIKIVDSTIIKIEKRKIIDSIFEDMYGNDKFNKFISDFCVKDDTSLKDEIVLLNDKLDLKPNKIEFLDNYILNNFSSSYLESIIKEYENFILSEKESINSILSNIGLFSEGKIYNNLLLSLDPLLKSFSYDDIRYNLHIDSFPRLIKPEDELKNYYDELKDKIRNLQNLCFYSKEDLISNLLLTKDNVEVIIYIIKELDERLKKFKKENDTYDFNDIAIMAIDVVKNNEDVREEIKNYFNEIMIDEYQDTSDLQETFISYISNDNVYMVGDIKQSIYRFRHANPEIFRTKYNKFSKNDGGFKIDLLKNFRSREEVLSSINNIFDSIMDEKIGNAEYHESHQMVFGNGNYTTNKAIQDYKLEVLNYKKDDDYKSYTNDEVEAFIIGKDIISKVKSHYQVIDKESGLLRDFDYGDACIIMDRGSAFDTYKKIFEYLAIPLVVWKDEVLNTSDDVSILKNIINLLIKIKNKQNDIEFRYYFTSIARSYLFSYDDRRIFKIFFDNSFENDELYKICLDISDRIDEIDNSTLLDLIIDKFNIYEKSILVGNVEQVIIRLDNFKAILKSLSDLGYTPYTLINYFKDSEDSEIRYSLNSKVSGNVNLMNIHKSKGLEFSICYFSGFSKKFNISDIKERFIFDDKYGFIIPFYKEGIGETILKDLFKSKYNIEDISERIRLFYVAVTRAKEKMIIVAPLDDSYSDVHNIVDDSIRIKYNSFLSIMNSIKSKISDCISNVSLNDLNISKKYNLIKKSNYKDSINESDILLDKRRINIINDVIDESHFSKVSHEIKSLDEINNMKLGTYIHYLFEIIDFKNPVIESKYKDLIMKFINQIDINYINVFKEYEFMYHENNNVMHGIIDLMLEYTDHISIIDYKLKNVVDDNYKKQINGYRHYIEMKTGKKVDVFLYSIINSTFFKIEK